MQDAFEKFLAENPELLEKARSRKPYWEQTPERQEQFKIAIEKIQEGYPRRAVIEWLIQECHWTLAFKTISDYLGDNLDEER
jgi:hypothetical protein|tara:strand:- start:633 stop:878 length:246 start_codon:yes stop_codon:yes gene_type:complete